MIPVQVNKPVSVTCVPSNLRAEPEYPDTDSALIGAVDAAERYLLVFTGRQVRDARIAELNAAVEACK
jgi:hypothetical protein